MVIVLDCWSAKKTPKSKANYKIKTFYKAKQECDNEADLTATCEIHVSVRAASHVDKCSSTKQKTHVATWRAHVEISTQGKITRVSYIIPKPCFQCIRYVDICMYDACEIQRVFCIILCFILCTFYWFSLDLHFPSYYGLSVWFPDMIKHLQYEEYQDKAKVRWTIACLSTTDHFHLLSS